MKDRDAVEQELKYVSQLAMNLTGFIEVSWEWQNDDEVEIFNEASSEGSPADDNQEIAELVSRLTGWEVYPVTKEEDYEPYPHKPFKVGLRKPKSV